MTIPDDVSFFRSKPVKRAFWGARGEMKRGLFFCCAGNSSYLFALAFSFSPRRRFEQPASAHRCMALARERNRGECFRARASEDESGEQKRREREREKDFFSFSRRRRFFDLDPPPFAKKKEEKLKTLFPSLASHFTRLKTSRSATSWPRSKRKRERERESGKVFVSFSSAHTN